MKDKVTGKGSQAGRRDPRTSQPVVGRTKAGSTRAVEAPDVDERQQLLAGLARGADQRKQAVREMLASFAKKRSTDSTEQRQQRIETISRIQGEAAEARAAAQDDLAGARQSWRSSTPAAEQPAAPRAQAPVAPARRRYYQPTKGAAVSSSAVPAAHPLPATPAPNRSTLPSSPTDVVAKREIESPGSKVEPKAPETAAPAPPAAPPVIPVPSVTVERVAALESSLQQMKEALKRPVPADPRVADIESRLAVLEDGLTRVIDRLTEEAGPQPKISQLEGRFDSVESQLATIEDQLAQTAVALERIVTMRQEPLEADPRIGSVEGSVAELSGRLQSLEDALGGVQQRLEVPRPESEELVGLAQRLNEIERSFEGVLSTVTELKQAGASVPRTETPAPAAPVILRDPEAAASPDRQSAARVLASLSKLVEGLRQNAARPAEGALAND